MSDAQSALPLQLRSLVTYITGSSFKRCPIEPTERDDRASRCLRACGKFRPQLAGAGDLSPRSVALYPCNEPYEREKTRVG